MSSDDSKETLIEPRPKRRLIMRWALVLASILVFGTPMAVYYFAGDDLYWKNQPLPHPLYEIRRSRDAYECFDLDFSPDGQYLAFHDRDTWQFDDLFGTKIVRLSDQKLVQSISGGPKKVAWSHDGKLIAMGGDKDGTNVELWNTEGWTKVVKLKHTPTTEYFPSYGKYNCTGLEFDRRGNLYMCQQVPYCCPPPDPADNQLSAWWNTKPQRIHDADMVADTFNEWGFDSSVASLDENNTRLFVTGGHYPTDKNGVCEVWHIRFDETGKGIPKFAYRFTVPNKYPDRRGRIVIRSCLSADGKFAGILGEGKFCIYRIHETHAELISTRSDGCSRQKMEQSLPSICQVTDASADGRFFAYLRDAGQPMVVRVTDGRPAFSLPRESWSVALSADGQFLATSDIKRNSVCVYRIPRDKK